MTGAFLAEACYRAARILSNERGDPHVDKKILIEGGANFVIPAGDQ